jgi:hypothetical protein
MGPHDVRDGSARSVRTAWSDAIRTLPQIVKLTGDEEFDEASKKSR